MNEPVDQQEVGQPDAGHHQQELLGPRTERRVLCADKYLGQIVVEQLVQHRSPPRGQILAGSSRSAAKREGPAHSSLPVPAHARTMSKKCAPGWLTSPEECCGLRATDRYTLKLGLAYILCIVPRGEVC